jgi:EAL and modified HD-GYP domain-containing signal transduction protein
MIHASIDKPYVSRHPVHDPHVRLHAYQLAVEQRDDINPEAALAAFLPIGLDQIVGKQPALVPVPQSALNSDLAEALTEEWSVDRVMIQVLGDVSVDPRVQQQLRSLKDKGYTVAVDDNDRIGADSGVEDGVTIVRVDAGHMDDDSLVRALDRLARVNVRRMAIHVDTYEQFERCRKDGFDLYQGYFFCSPSGEGSQIPQNRLAALRVLTKLRNADVPLGEIEETIESDVALSYNLLRFVNSAFVGLRRDVDSIGHAVKLVGTDRIRHWASLLMFSRMEDKPRELMITAIVRAAQCERLALAAEFSNPESFFTVGLLSVLDALMDRPMEDAIEELPLSQALQDALLDHTGSLGEALSCVLAYEQNDWADVRFAGLAPMALRGQYIDSLEWARRISDGLRI